LVLTISLLLAASLTTPMNKEIYEVLWRLQGTMIPAFKNQKILKVEM